MPNTTLTADIIAKEATMILDNNLVMAKQVYRGYESEYSSRVNGYEVGETISIRKPTDFTVRTGSVAVSQDVVEGKTSLTIDQKVGIDFEFTSNDLTLRISDLSERVIKPAMVQLANHVDRYLMNLYTQIPSWVGTPGNVINSYSDFAKAPERLDEFAIPMSDRSAVLSPADHWALLGAQTGLYIQDPAKGAYREGSLGKIGGVDTYMAQNVPTHVVGVATGAPVVNGAAQNVTYDSVKNTNIQTLITGGWTASQAGILKAGDVFSMAGVFAVNPVTKAALPFLKQFTVMADAASSAGGAATLAIHPAIITTGAFQNVSAAPANSAVITVVGTGGAGYRQNMVFHKNAFALAMVPLEMPVAAVGGARQSYKGTSVRIIPTYDGVNDVSKWRADILFGAKAIDPRLATRFSGTP